MATGAKRAQSAIEIGVLDRLKEQMRTRGLTQNALAASVDLSPAQLSRILNAGRPATFTEIYDISRALGMELSDVVRAAERAHYKPGIPESARIADVEVAVALASDSDADQPERAKRAREQQQGRAVVHLRTGRGVGGHR